MDSSGYIEKFEVKVRADDVVEVRRLQGNQRRSAFDEYDLELDNLRRDTISVLVEMLRKDRLHDSDELKVLGGHLYEALFSEQVSTELMRSLNRNDPQVKLSKVELEFEEKQQELASWPWEYLFCPLRFRRAGTGKFLARTSKLVLNRYVPLDSRNSLLVEKPPIKLLFVAANPAKGDKLKSFSYTALLEDLRELEKDKDLDSMLKVYTLVGENDETVATREQFINMVEGIRPHVIHFVGHGKYEDGVGKIAFVGEPRWMSEEDLAERLYEVGSLRLVFLQACESARSSSHQAVSGVAMRLAHQGIPAVVAMQYEIESVVANKFARAFYKALAEFEDVDVAVQTGRGQLRNDLEKAGVSHEFGLPVLYLGEGGSLLSRSETRRLGTREPDAASRSSVSCPWCNRDDAGGASSRYCGKCGEFLKCPECGTRVEEPHNHCSECGTPLLKRDRLDTSSRDRPDAGRPLTVDPTRDIRG